MNDSNVIGDYTIVLGDYVQREEIKKLIYKAKRGGVEPSYDLFLDIVEESYLPAQTVIEREKQLLRRLSIGQQ